MKKILLLIFVAFCALQLKAQDDETLDILLFGHSYGVDCSEHLPKLIDAAGIKTVRIARFIKGNCSLEERHKFFKDDWTKGYSECEPGSVEYVDRPCTFKEAVATRKWDYVIFQTSLEKQGQYETYQPYLNEMVAYIRQVSNEKFGAEPVICWNMFWPVSSLLKYAQSPTSNLRLSLYGNDSDNMFDKYMAAAKEMSADTGIDNIIPSGTAIMNLRASYLNTPQSKAFTRDGYHLSYGEGRYAAACVFFEYMVAPRYGISVLGNSLRFPDLKPAVTDKNAEFLQLCAVEAVKNPFTVNAQLGPKPKKHSEMIGQIVSAGEAEAKTSRFDKELIIKYLADQSTGQTLYEQLKKTDVKLCKKLAREVVSSRHAKQTLDIMSYDAQVVEKTSNSLRHIITLDYLFAKPCELKGIVASFSKATMCGFKDKRSGVVSIAIWDDSRDPHKGEVPGCVTLTFDKQIYKEPVAVDLRNGAVYSLIMKGGRIYEIPYYDSPVVVTEKELVSGIIR